MKMVGLVVRISELPLLVDIVSPWGLTNSSQMETERPDNYVTAMLGHTVFQMQGLRSLHMSL